MSTQEPLDLVGLMIALLTFYISKDIAAIIGPYAAICMLACAGAALSLSGNSTQISPIGAIWYIVLRIAVAVSITVALAELIQNIWPWAKPRYSLSPIAFAIGWIKDYESVRLWIESNIEKRARNGK